MVKEYVEQRDGAYYVAGTRVSLDSVIYLFREGASPEGICEEFELLTLEQVYGAITFYLANQDEIDAYLGDQQQKLSEIAKNSTSPPPELRNKIERARLRTGTRRS